jgi:uncharacterized membrane protein
MTAMTTRPASRIVSVDVVRGLAIFVMVPANMAAYVYDEPHAFWFRVASSFAAPTFVAVAGMMVALAAGRGHYGLRAALIRGALLLTTAALIEVVLYKVVPFYSYDVLYLIGIACPLTYLFTLLPRAWQLALIALIFLATPVLQWKFGYTDYPGEQIFWGSQAGTRGVVPKNPTGWLQHLFIDGWFPLFPWLGISFAGATIAQTFFMPPREENSRAMALAAVGFLIVGIAAWWIHPGPAYVRDGFSELFYPPTIGFIMTACGTLLALLWAVSFAPGAVIFVPLRWLGECSLLMYILHLAIISTILGPLFPERDLPTFLLIDLATIVVLVGVAAAVRQGKAAWPDRPYLVRFLFGG